MQSYESVSPQSLLNNAMQVLRSRILSGELKSGEWLLPERDMAKQMGISRSSLHQAILELEYQGFVKVVPRRGTQVCDFRKYPTAHSLSALMNNDSLNLDYSIFRDMMEFRLNIESECAKLACDHAYESTLREMEELTFAMEEDGADAAALAYAFHYKLTQASGNSLYSMVFRGFEPVITNMIDNHYDTNPDDIACAAQMRRDLLKLIRSGDKEGAAAQSRRIITQGIRVLERRYKEREHELSGNN